MEKCFKTEEWTLEIGETTFLGSVVNFFTPPDSAMNSERKKKYCIHSTLLLGHTLHSLGSLSGGAQRTIQVLVIESGSATHKSRALSTILSLRPHS